MSGSWRIEFKDTVPQFQSSGAFRKRHKHDLNPQGAELSKQYGKETVNLWMHIEKAEGICGQNGTLLTI
ncbi:MAG: hypothetical protein LWX51_10140 [Deltaproteobacteria bacterium]|jgi:hypothetical protein|nr:hypothetical protein [Deltaproteobacteria bacterium]